MARFYVDEDLSDELAVALRGRGHDAVHTREAGNKGEIDPKQFWTAVREDRVLLTANAGHFRMLHEAWLVWSGAAGGALPPHPGIVILPNKSMVTLVTLLEVVEEFARRGEPEAVRNRLLEWRRGTGWRDLSAVR